MSFQSNLTLAFQRIAQEFNTHRGEVDSVTGSLSNLDTTAQGNLVSALNELHTEIDAIDISSLIDDVATAATDKTYSIDKIKSLIQAAKDEILGGAGSAFDTLQELATLITDNDSDISTILTSLGNRVRVDAAQSFSAAEKLQARENIDAVSSIEVGDVNHNFVADFTGALT